VTSTAAALSLALGSQAVVAAPAGVALTVTGAALAGVAAGGGVAAALTFMSVTKLQIGIAATALIAGAGAFVVQAQNNESLRNELAGLPQPSAEISQLQETNRQLARAASEAAALHVNDAELARLREEAIAVQNRIQATALAVARAPAPPRLRLPGETYEVKQLDQPPKLNRPAYPLYPPKMAEAGISGDVTVELLIDSQGNVAEVRVMRSSQPEFEESAIMAVMQWKFDPGQKNGRVVNTRATQLIKFNLNDGPPDSPSTWF
jgi:TonB family protein